MAKTYKKTILHVGNYESPDGSVVVTPKRLKHWEQEHNRLKANKQVVPIGWDHADEIASAVPLSADKYKKRRSAKDTVGHMVDFKVSPTGKSAELTMRIHKKDAQEAAKDNRVFVSPVIFDAWKDGSGKEYKDVITHVDFVNHPVDHSQGPFQQAMSLKAPDEGDVWSGIRLGLGKPAFWEDAKFTRMGKGKAKTKYAMADDDEEEDMDDDEYVDGEGDDDIDLDVDVDVDEVDESEEAEEGDEVEEDDADNLDVDLDEEDDLFDLEEDEDIVAMETDMEAEYAELGGQILEDLAQAGIAPPEGVDPIMEPVPFLQQLCAALRQKKMDSEEEDSFEEDTFEPDLSDGGAGEEKIEMTNPDFATMSLAQKKMAKQLEATQKRILRMARQEKLTALDELLRTGRVTPAEHKKYSEHVKAVRMSLDDNGDAKPLKIDTFIQSRNSIPAGSVCPVGKGAQGMSLRGAKVVEPETSEMHDHVTPEDAKQYVDSMAQRHPRVIRT